jgi:hypothetical protein
MKYSLYNAIVMYLIAALFISGCGAYGFPINNDLIKPLEDGQVVGLYPRTAMFIVKQALSQAPLSRILTDGKNYAFFYPFRDSQALAWVAYNLEKEQLIGTSKYLQERMANLANYKTGNELFDYLKNSGWTEIKPSQMPAWFVTAVEIAQASTITVINSMPTFMIFCIPENIFIPEQDTKVY